ncbi:MAG: hypothetical protein ACRDT6_16220 [Micromonosporaceae bacterium]
MTTHKSFKSRVRTRMAKTGESYTTARRHLLTKVALMPAAVETVDVAMSRKVSDSALRERTGRGWAEWFALLDGWGGTQHSHTEIARWLGGEHEVDSWSAQTVTVGYEQARGMRVLGQQSNGAFAANVTRTVAAPAERLFEAFADELTRDRWLPDAKLRVRTATASRSFRADWEEDGTRIAVGFTAKTDAKTEVSVLHEKLADGEAVAELKTYWRERLTALKQLLES